MSSQHNTDYNTLLMQQIHLGNFDECDKILMSDNILSYNTLFEAFTIACKQKNNQLIESVIKSKIMNYRINSKFSDNYRDSLIQYCIINGNEFSTTLIIESCEHEEIKVTTIEFIIALFYSLGKYKIANGLISKYNSNCENIYIKLFSLITNENIDGLKHVNVFQNIFNIDINIPTVRKWSISNATTKKNIDLLKYLASIYNFTIHDFVDIIYNINNRPSYNIKEQNHIVRWLVKNYRHLVTSDDLFVMYRFIVIEIDYRNIDSVLYVLKYIKFNAFYLKKICNSVLEYGSMYMFKKMMDFKKFSYLNPERVLRICCSSFCSEIFEYAIKNYKYEKHEIDHVFKMHRSLHNFDACQRISNALPYKYFVNQSEDGEYKCFILGEDTN